VLQQTIQGLEIAELSLTQLAVLSTTSLLQFVACFHLGISILGINPPAQWAREQKAFLCDVASRKNN
jgi:hypothetical protein